MSEPQRDDLELSLNIKGILARAVLKGQTQKGLRLIVVLPDGTTATVEEIHDLTNGNGRDSH